FRCASVIFGRSRGSGVFEWPPRNRCVAWTRAPGFPGASPAAAPDKAADRTRLARQITQAVNPPEDRQRAATQRGAGGNEFPPAPEYFPNAQSSRAERNSNQQLS